MKNDTFATCMGLILSALVMIVVGVVMNAWALHVIWNWFIPPIFNLTSLTIWQAAGVAMVFEMFTGTNRTQKHTSSKSSSDKTVGEIFIEGLIVAVMTPVLSVLIAWVIHTLAF